MAELAPLLRACVWPRWLLLEAALEQASTSGDLHLAALVLRAQIEELDALGHVQRVLSIFWTSFSTGAWDAESISGQIAGALGLADDPRTTEWDEKSIATTLKTLRDRVLPRLRTKTADELVQKASDAASSHRRPESLQKAFDDLGDYVHPNYGSHVLSVSPHSEQAAQVFVDAFVAVYERFLEFPWAHEPDDADPDDVEPKEDGWEKQAMLLRLKPPFLALAEDTVRVLAPYHPAAAEIGTSPWIDAVNEFHRCLERERQQDAEGRAIESGKMRAAFEETGVPELGIDVGAIRMLRERGAPFHSWPEFIRTPAGRVAYARLVENERFLAKEAEAAKPDVDAPDASVPLSLLLSALTFSINITEFKLQELARNAARLINEDNVLGAALVVRSMLEHHAVAVELGSKLRNLSENIDRKAPDERQVNDALDEAEKQVARVLAGTSGSPEVTSSWRARWKETVRSHYNVMKPIRSLDGKMPGFLKTYGLLSHVVHGTVCTGGDLLGLRKSGARPGQTILAQLVLNLASLIDMNAMMDRQASVMFVARRLDYARRDPRGVGQALRSMRILPGQKLKHGRDVFGSGTAKDPFRFRRGLPYHDAYYAYLQQEGIRVRARWVDMFAGGVGDRVQTEDGRTLYFLNEDFGPKDQ